ncbi:MAG: hypothetical protein IT428_06080 [Planctomycetaceae bacterium]|nr:hypothetical protein [Planctomycetaceae bacterium]
MDDNALYYTLSTIAQTIASAFGVMAAFALFKTQTFDSIEALAKLTVRELERFGMDPVQAVLIARREGFQGIDAHLKQLEEGNNTKYQRTNDLMIACSRLANIHRFKTHLLRRIWRAVHWVAWSIMICLVCLPLVPLVAKHWIPYWLMIVTVLTVAMNTVFLFIRLIRDLVDDDSFFRSVSIEDASERKDGWWFTSPQRD